MKASCYKIEIMTVEESGQATRGKNVKILKPKSIYLWTTSDVQKWFERHCGDLYAAYCNYFLQHEINGRTLIRLNLNSLRKLGINNDKDCDMILREILKLRLKADFLEIRDLERRVNLVLNSLE